MRLPEAVRAPDDAAPIWTRAKKSRGNPILRLILAILVIVGLLTLVLAGVDQSFAKGGQRVDDLIGSIVHSITGAKAKATAMDQVTPSEPASAPAAASSAPAAPAASSAAPAPAPAASAPAAKH
jgi:hypothetical protein